MWEENRRIIERSRDKKKVDIVVIWVTGKIWGAIKRS